MTLEDSPPPYRTVVFDCDSTLSEIEGIEALATPEQANEVARLTDRAMAGEVPLEEVFGARLEIVRPSRDDLVRVGRLYAETALANTRELIAALQALEKRVVIVSGGLLPAVRDFAGWLGVDEVHAVPVAFAEDGSYGSFDARSPLARAGGKIDVVGEIARDGAPLALVGDGATDLEAGHLAARFLAFGGVERRENVFVEAAVHSTSPDFAALVPLLLTDEERARLASTTQHAALLAAAPH